MTPRLETLRERILHWYSRVKRDLPWRRTRDPYPVWVSEVMLQQTRVETVVPYFERFISRFPDVTSLARAREPDVLAAWSGLGYYARARNMQAAARMMVREHAGRVPGDREALLQLPGIGGYTAGAIESIAFGRPAAAVDGNVIRVLARVLGLRGRRDSADLRRRVTECAESMAHGPRPGDWTQALMELGARICLPRDPLCDLCPAAGSCLARRSGTPDRFPEASRPKAPRAERRVLLVARSGARVLLIQDEADSRATWTLPYAGPRSANALAKRLLGETPPALASGSFRHRTFSHSITYEVWLLDLVRARASREGEIWATPGELQRLPVRSHTLKAIRNLHR